MSRDAVLSADILSAMEDRHGEVFTQALIDQIHHQDSPDRDLQCLEVLQMSEIAHRLRAHVREMIRDYRLLEQREHMLMTELEYLQKEMREKRRYVRARGEDHASIGGVYNLYRMAWRDFLYAFDCYRRKAALKGPDGVRVKAKALAAGRYSAGEKLKGEKAAQLASAILRQSRERKALQEAA